MHWLVVLEHRLCTSLSLLPGRWKYPLRYDSLVWPSCTTRTKASITVWCDRCSWNVACMGIGVACVLNLTQPSNVMVYDFMHSIQYSNNMCVYALYYIESRI